MLNNINMEFIQALNPMYAIPIVAVIFCAFIVYAFGFKSSVPPPSFEGIEEEKKYSKKKRAKENQKVNKVVQNGKLNGSSVKSNTVSSKKNASEKATIVEKSPIVDKNPAVEKKTNKKTKQQTEKKPPQGKKVESLPQEDLNDDGWVQLVSKKGRKNRKKDEASSVEVQSTAETLIEGEPSKLSNVLVVEDSPKVDPPKENLVDQKQSLSESTTKVSKVKESSNTEKFKRENVPFPVPDENVEKQPVIEPVPKGSKVLEESNKSKKKKKKNLEANQSEKQSAGKITNTSESSVVKEEKISEIPPLQEKAISKPSVTETSQSIEKVKEAEPSEVKASNVAFDELAGMYPETKEKKKKKVRRDH